MGGAFYKTYKTYKTYKIFGWLESTRIAVIYNQVRNAPADFSRAGFKRAWLAKQYQPTAVPPVLTVNVCYCELPCFARGVVTVNLTR